MSRENPLTKLQFMEKVQENKSIECPLLLNEDKLCPVHILSSENSPTEVQFIETDLEDECLNTYLSADETKPEPVYTINCVMATSVELHTLETDQINSEQSYFMSDAEKDETDDYSMQVHELFKSDLVNKTSENVSRAILVENNLVKYMTKNNVIDNKYMEINSVITGIEKSTEINMEDLTVIHDEYDPNHVLPINNSSESNDQVSNETSSIITHNNKIDMMELYEYLWCGNHTKILKQLCELITEDEDDSIDGIESKLFQESLKYNETSDQIDYGKRVSDDIANILANRVSLPKEKSEIDKTRNKKKNSENQQKHAEFKINSIKINSLIEYFRQYVTPFCCFCIAIAVCGLKYFYGL